ncbi:MAG TPA: hypothetical protein VGS12_13475 [Caulobacteraceae bacterium]|nr:hypothetical protein [Caulobacteraceae bacterium]
MSREPRHCLGCGEAIPWYEVFCDACWRLVDPWTRYDLHWWACCERRGAPDEVDEAFAAVRVTLAGATAAVRKIRRRRAARARLAEIRRSLYGRAA